MGKKAAGENSPREDAWLQNHLRACPECSGLEDQLELTWTALENHPMIEPSAASLTQLRSRIQAERNGAVHIRSPFWKWQFAAAAACVLFASVLFMKSDLFRPAADRRPADETGLVSDHAADDQFLQDLDEALQNSAVDSLSVYDSWPGSAAENPGPDTPHSKRDGRIRQKKEPA
jgi:hypothetical protein